MRACSAPAQALGKAAHVALCDLFCQHTTAAPDFLAVASPASLLSSRSSARFCWRRGGLAPLGLRSEVLNAPVEPVSGAKVELSKRCLVAVAKGHQR
jgi:hypothetical protein